MAESTSFKGREVAWKKFILSHWAHYVVAAEKAYIEHGPGAILIDIAHAPTAAVLRERSIEYVTLENANILMPNLSSAVLSMYVGDSDPCEETIFVFADFEQATGQIWRQRRGVDGSPLPDADLFWSNRERNCPKCGTSFASVRARGQCPNCGKLFVASEGDG